MKFLRLQRIGADTQEQGKARSSFLLRMALSLFAGVFAILLSAPSSAAAESNIYISQNGGGTGTSCSSASPVAWFNNSGNWGNGSAQIGPGTTVHLCGTITQEIFVGGSGSSGNPITIQFDPTTSGNISVPTEKDAQLIWLGSNNYITIIGHSSEGTSPDCQATNNGSPPLTYQNTFSCINGNNSHDITVEDFGCANLYQHTSSTDTTFGSDTQGCYYANPVGANVTIHDSTFHDSGDGILFDSGSGSINANIYNNNLYNINHLFAWVCDATLSGIQFHDNQIHDPANWDTGAADAYHHDGDFFVGTSSGTCSDIYDYNNWYYGSWGENVTSPIFVDGNGNVFTAVYVFNDVFQNSYTANGWTNGINLIAQGTIFAYNNTVICAVTSSQNLGLQMSHIIDDRNNVQTGCQQFFSTSNDVGTKITAMDYNVYANVASSGSAAFSFLTSLISTGGSGTLAAQFATWQEDVQRITAGSEAHSVAVSSANLNADGLPLSGSPVIGAGTNLTSLCSGVLAALCSDTSLGNSRTPLARPSSGPWTIGAYESGAVAGQPAPPSGLIATVE